MSHSLSPELLALAKKIHAEYPVDPKHLDFRADSAFTQWVNNARLIISTLDPNIQQVFAEIASGLRQA